MDDVPPPVSRPMRVLWLCGGLVCVGLGGVGVIVPGLPSTIFYIMAAACFTRSSPRLETWVLELPGVGPMVRDYRAGLGMPRRAKVYASGSIVVFSAVAVGVMSSTTARAVLVVAAVIGVLVVTLWVPTRETVLARRAGAD